jgi:uroporphyrinogen-III synthase
MRPLVILRPEPGASATARAAEQLGLRSVVIPLFAVEPREWRSADPREFDALLLTSANAVRHGGPGLSRLQGLPAYCVGEATAGAARDAGFAVAGVGKAGVDALLDSLPAGLRLLHLCGSDRREPHGPRQSVAPIPVYRSAQLPLPEGFERLEGSVIAIHSPRAGARLAELAERERLARETIAIAAISGEAAEAAGEGWGDIGTATEPTDRALLALASRLCNNP